MTRTMKLAGGSVINNSGLHKLSQVRRMLASLLALVLFSTQVMGQTLSVQQNPTDTSVRTIRLAQLDPGTPGSSPSWPGEIDIDPPVIDHEALETGVAGESQRFSAVVVDDRGLTHVVLYHRDRSGAQYSNIEMEKTDATNEYTAVVDTTEGQASIEYYIEALDTGGNRVLKGFPFFPLVRELDPGQTTTAEVTESSGPDKRLIFVAVGVAVLGLAALLLSGGGSDDPPEPGGPEPVPTVPINITITPP